jgi:hypothetical protein
LQLNNRRPRKVMPAAKNLLVVFIVYSPCLGQWHLTSAASTPSRPADSK